MSKVVFSLFSLLLLRPQGFHRLQFGCIGRRVAAEQPAQRHGKAEGRKRHPSGGENGHLEQGQLGCRSHIACDYNPNFPSETYEHYDTSPIKWDSRKTLLLKSSKLETGVFYYGQKSLFSGN